MSSSPTKPWFNGRFVGAGYSMPIAWQGWAVLGAGIGAMLLSLVLVHSPARTWIDLAILAAVMATIRLKRASD